MVNTVAIVSLSAGTIGEKFVEQFQHLTILMWI